MDDRVNQCRLSLRESSVNFESQKGRCSRNTTIPAFRWILSDGNESLGNSVPSPPDPLTPKTGRGGARFSYEVLRCLSTFSSAQGKPQPQSGISNDRCVPHYHSARCLHRQNRNKLSSFALSKQNLATNLRLFLGLTREIDIRLPMRCVAFHPFKSGDSNVLVSIQKKSRKQAAMPVASPYR